MHFFLLRARRDQWNDIFILSLNFRCHGNIKVEIGRCKMLYHTINLIPTHWWFYLFIILVSNNDFSIWWSYPGILQDTHLLRNDIHSDYLSALFIPKICSIMLKFLCISERQNVLVAWNNGCYAFNNVHNTVKILF